ncbi:hypothetical protein ACHHYP_16532 [Achlya hypogyna]|uniref:Uncharacterized protein n=1 Tax=Achlya hypogyna TaxID=1202772 RepID=A0A1V9ZEJ0_ACHHY|nr:hypothetical protein ACHHYP_16532 [Achlya hypogyna]
MQASPCVEKRTEVRRETPLSPAHKALSSKYTAPSGVSVLHAQFQHADSDDDDASQDWFVNDRPAEPSPVPTAVADTAPSVQRLSISNETDEDDTALRTSPLGFLHLRPAETGVLIMELGLSDQSMLKQYGAKYFKIYLPQVTPTQREFCLYGRNVLNKQKIRFSLCETKASKRNNPGYAGKVTITNTPLGKRYKVRRNSISRAHETQVVCPPSKQRSAFTVELHDRTHVLDVLLQPQNPLLNLLRGKTQREPEKCSSSVEKFTNPLVHIQCPKAMTSWLRIDKEGEASGSKYFIYYAKPFSMFLSAAIAVAIHANLLE